MLTSNELAAWLRGLTNPCNVTRTGRLIVFGPGDKHQVFEACDYTQILTPPPGARNQQPYTRRQVYCIGQRPDWLTKPRYPAGGGLRGTAVCLVLAGEPHEWYVAAHTDDKRPPPATELNPFGHMFILAPWDVPGGRKIDADLDVVYKRFAAHWE